jgi:competence protein ComEC
MQYGISLFKRIPVLRFLMPLIGGILCQFYYHVSLITAVTGICISIMLLSGYLLLNHANRFRFIWINGIAISLLFFAIGNALGFIKNSKHHPQHVGNYYTPGCLAIVTLQEPLVTKPKSYKALATIDAVLVNGKWQPVFGKILLYFKKDLVKPNLSYGNQLVITKPIVLITNAGNPGGFNYKQYCAFQHIYYQLFLGNNNFKTLDSSRKSAFDTYLINTRLAVLAILRRYIHSANELAVAEALLIGYRDDLDRDLVQAYSNTGVVHIIAISGLHLGMIYGLLVLLIKPFRRYRLTVFLKPIIIIVILWGFTFIAGAVPSILRSAVMFTCIVLGESIGKRTNIYNTLAVSALVILLFNPFSLWDVGFQLSYAAVLSIILFAKNIENLFYFKNKLLKWFWALNALTLSAQILTLPIILYHFHQFPTLFFVTNLVAVPLSCIILYAELLLLVLSVLPTVATFVGFITERLLWVMNDFIERVNQLPFAVLNGLQINIIQIIMLYGAIGGITWWLLNKKPKALLIGLSALLLFCVVRYWDFMSRNQQQQLVVYNVPQHASIDIMQGRQYMFVGDSLLQADGFLRNFHLQPSRVLHRVAVADSLNNIVITHNTIISTNKAVIIVDKPLPKYFQPKQKIIADVVILSKNPKLYFSQLIKVFNCNQYVFDASNPAWKIKYWKKDADSLGIKYHVVAESGAFIFGF